MKCLYFFLPKTNLKIWPSRSIKMRPLLSKNAFPGINILHFCPRKTPATNFLISSIKSLEDQKTKIENYAKAQDAENSFTLFYYQLIRFFL